MTETFITLTDFIHSRGITMTARPVATNPNMPDCDMDHWRCELKFSPDHKMSVCFSMGRGHEGRAPTVEAVLDCLASDAAGVENARSFEEWASEYGYDADSRKALATYRACVRQSKRLKEWLGIQYGILLWETER